MRKVKQRGRIRGRVGGVCEERDAERWRGYRRMIKELKRN